VTARRRRPPGEGSIFRYQTKAGVTRFGIKFNVPSAGGGRKQVLRRRDPSGQPWLTRDAAAAALREMVVKAGKGEWTEPSMQPLGEWLGTWADGLRVQPSTKARYRNAIDCHVLPHIGGVPLARLTSARLDALYRRLEDSGLSLRSVRAVSMILGAALKAAADAEPPLLARNPAAKASPPTAREALAAAPEMRPWTAGQLRAFLDWSAAHSQLHAAWHVLACTGMRRGELLALRWRDIDLDAATVSVSRSLGTVRSKGQRGYLREGPTKTCKPRVVDLDPATVAMLRAWKRERGAMALQLARNDAVVFGDHEGRFRHPERLSHLFRETQQRCSRMLGDAAPPLIRLHDLRHTHATILLRDRENVKVVSERLGHASVTVTLTTYSHVMPGDQRHAAARFAALVGGADA
jgi:integrase